MITIKVESNFGLIDVLTTKDVDAAKDFLISQFDAMEISVSNGERKSVKIVVDL